MVMVRKSGAARNIFCARIHLKSRFDRELVVFFRDPEIFLRDEELLGEILVFLKWLVGKNAFYRDRKLRPRRDPENYTGLLALIIERIGDAQLRRIYASLLVKQKFRYGLVSFHIADV